MGYSIFVRGASLYVAGTTVRSGHGQDTLLLKYDAVGGAFKWARFYDGSLHKGEWVGGLAADGKSVYVAGMVNGTAAWDGDALVVRYTPSGLFKWAKVRKGSKGGADSWNDVAVAPDGAAVTAGTLWSTAYGDDMMAGHYARDGLSWSFAQLRGGPGNQSDDGMAVEIDSYGVMYFAGSLSTGATFGTDGVVMCLNPDWSEIWTSTTQTAGDDGFADVSLSSNAVWTTGWWDYDAYGADFFVAKFMKL